MKRRTTILIAIFVSIGLVSLVIMNTPTNAERNRIYRTNSGIISLGPNQSLRITTVNQGDETIRVSFRTLEYSRGNCNDAACKLTIASETISDPVTLAPGEGLSADIQNSGVAGIQTEMLHNKYPENMKHEIVDTSTGNTVVTWWGK